MLPSFALSASLCVLGPPAIDAATSPASATTASSTDAAAPSDASSDHDGSSEPVGRATTTAATKTRWLRACAPGTEPCTRARAARLTLGLVSLAAAAAGAGTLLIVGDRLGAGDPGAMLMGMGALGMAGVTVGALAAGVGGDEPNSPDRIRPATVGLRSVFDGTTTLGESRPPTMALRLAPTWYFPDGRGRLRFLGSVDGQLGSRVDVDPRADAGETFPTALEQRRWGFDLAADLAFALPYAPEGARRPKLGGWELRWRPSAHLRRDANLGRGAYATRRYERTMILPLTVGARWIVSPRQRFTFYVGPRFDFLAVGTGEDALARGRPQVGAIYGEAWYDIDFPGLLRGRAAERYTLQGQLSMGYIHSRFGGDGINVGGARGFIGPAEAAWRMKLRRHGGRSALLMGVGGRAGNGLALFAELGVALPDLGRDPSRALPPGRPASSTPQASPEGP